MKRAQMIPMRNNPRMLAALICSVVIASALGALPAMAAEGPSPADTATGWIFRWVNFLIVVGLMVYLFRSMGAPQFKERAKEIAARIQEAAKTRDDAEAGLESARKKLAAVDQEIERLREQSRQDEAAEADRLKMMTDADVERINHAAVMEIEAAERAARLQLKAAAARTAVQRAVGILRQKMNRDRQGGLMGRFVREILEWVQ